MAAAIASSASTTAPPSPHVMFLIGSKLKQAACPKLPRRRPRVVDPNACAASSITQQSLALGERQERVQVAGLTAEMDRHDRLGARRDPPADVGDVDEHRRCVHVAEDRRRAGRQDRLHARRERQRRDDHLVARPDAEPGERDVEGRGAAVDRDRVAAPEIRLERRLEGARGRAEAEPAGGEDLRDRSRLLVAEDRTRHGDHRGSRHADPCSRARPAAIVPKSRAVVGGADARGLGGRPKGLARAADGVSQRREALVSRSARIAIAQ